MADPIWSEHTNNQLPTLPTFTVPHGLPGNYDGFNPEGGSPFVYRGEPIAGVQLRPSSYMVGSGGGVGSGGLGQVPQNVGTPFGPTAMQAMGEGTGYPSVPQAQRVPFFGPVPSGYIRSPFYNNPYYAAGGAGARAPFGAQAGVSAAGGLGAGGQLGNPFIRATGGTGGGIGGQGSVAPSISNPVNLRLQHAQNTIDPVLGVGWSQQFTDAHGGITPIDFYAPQFSYLQDPERIVNAAVNAAINDGRWHPMEVADWQRAHGNTPIPDEQWREWAYINSHGGPDFGAPAGTNPFGVS